MLTYGRFAVPLHVLAYSLGNSMSKAAERWSLNSLREKPIKVGAKVVSHGRYVTFQMAEAARVAADVPANPVADRPVAGTPGASKAIDITATFLESAQRGRDYYETKGINRLRAPPTDDGGSHCFGARCICPIEWSRWNEAAESPEFLCAR